MSVTPALHDRAPNRWRPNASRYNFTSEPRLDVALRYPGEPTEEEDLAAAKIQAGFRGKKVRDELRATTNGGDGQAEETEEAAAAEENDEDGGDAVDVGALLETAGGKELKALVEAKLDQEVGELKADIEQKLTAQNLSLTSTVSALEERIAPKKK